MPRSFQDSFFRKNLANLITLGRIAFCLASFTCAILVLLQKAHSPVYGFFGLLFLIASALTDYFDGLVARKLNIFTKMGPLADQMMDKMVYCIIFPTIAVGAMAVDGDKNMNHVIVILVLCVSLLVRDHYVNFLRVLADRHQGDSSVGQVGKLRTLLALPTSCFLYAYCFCNGQAEDVFNLNSLVIWSTELDLRYYYVLEIFLVVINIVSAISYTRSYGPYFMLDLCGDDDELRRKILAIFPNSLTLMNAIMGIIAMILAWNEKFHLAFVMLMAAAIFDKLDGAAARKLGLVEERVEGTRQFTPGAILDDIADVISFCLAPAALGFAYFRHEPFAYVFFIYTFAGMARLIFFTLDRHPLKGYFKGLPCPAGALLTGGVVHAAFTLSPEGFSSFYIVLGIFIFVGILMNAYFIYYVHFGQLMGRSKMLTRFIISLMIITSFSHYLGAFAILIMCCYLCSPFYMHLPKSQS